MEFKFNIKALAIHYILFTVFLYMKAFTIYDSLFLYGGFYYSL